MNNPLLKKSLLGICLLLVLFSFGNCKKDGGTIKRSRDQKELDNLKAEIQNAAGQLSCENSADWKFVTLFEGACSLPTYIAYSTKIDEASFLQKVALHREKLGAFNAIYHKNAICPMIGYIPPKRVECVDGKPKFIYQP